MNNPLLYTIAFSQLPGINIYDRSLLIKKFGNASEIYRACQIGPQAFDGLALKCLECLQLAWPLKDAAREIERMTKLAINATCLEEAAYPNRLYQCEDAPVLLYSKGTKKWNLPNLVSIVGTRNHTRYAGKIIEELLEGLLHLNLGIVSGLALGIDGIVHQKACQFQIPNWGVLASGLDAIYPTQHERLAHQMLEHGGILSENPTETIPLPYQFPKRNRIVAGMSDATIVIESQLQGGSMITAGLARGYNREVFAVPGRISDHKSKGCLALIQSNTAQLYQNPTQLLDQLGWSLPAVKMPQQKTISRSLAPIAQEILQVIVKEGPIHRDQLANQFKINIGLLSTHLLTLELNGLIHPHGGAYYSNG